ncbi:MAG: hypothetical protein ACOC46_01630 [Pirellulales bacterium]
MHRSDRCPPVLQFSLFGRLGQIMRPVRKLTLREMFVVSKRATKELVEHLEQNFANRAHELESLLRPHKPEKKKGKARPPVTDVTVHNVAHRALESHEFSERVCDQLSEVLAAIREKGHREIV